MLVAFAQSNADWLPSWSKAYIQECMHVPQCAQVRTHALHHFSDPEVNLLLTSAFAPFITVHVTTCWQIPPLGPAGPAEPATAYWKILFTAAARECCRHVRTATKVRLQTCVLIPRLHDQGLLSSALAGMHREMEAAIVVTCTTHAGEPHPLKDSL